MKLYTADYAPNPRRVRWMMAEKGITDIEIVPVNIMALEHKHQAIVGNNGAALPVLERDDGTILAESVAIGRYLESLYPEPNLYGYEPLEIAQIEMWTRRVELKLANSLMLATRLSHPALTVLEAANPAVADYFTTTATAFSVELDAHLAGRDFIAADRVTVADIVAVCALDFARIVRYRPDKSLENLGRWLKDIRARPAANAAL